MIVEFINRAQVDDAGNPEGQPQQKGHAIPGSVISYQHAGGDRKAEQGRNDFSARPRQRIQYDIEFPQEGAQDDSPAAGHNRQPPGKPNGPQSFKFLEYSHICLDATKTHFETPSCENDHVHWVRIGTGEFYLSFLAVFRLPARSCSHGSKASGSKASCKNSVYLRRSYPNQPSQSA